MFHAMVFAWQEDIVILNEAKDPMQRCGQVRQASPAQTTSGLRNSPERLTGPYLRNVGEGRPSALLGDLT